MGVTGTGAVAGYFATEDIYLDQGPSNNIIGTPALGDRNVLANAAKAIDMYGPGTNGNVIQNNDFCMTPSGARSTCHTGVDHDFGPKATQIGGFDANELNVIGPTTRNGVEISHGWDPNGQDTSTKWLNMDIHVEGNWIGFKIDGSYNAKFRSGNVKPTGYDGNGVNVYDGCKDNVVDGNYIGSVFDGINTQTPNCFDNVIQNNIIGVSPKGQAAPMNWWGIHVRQGTYGTLIKNNTIRNAVLGGIGLVTGNERTIEITRNIVSNTSGPAIHLSRPVTARRPGRTTCTHRRSSRRRQRHPCRGQGSRRNRRGLPGFTHCRPERPADCLPGQRNGRRQRQLDRPDIDRQQHPGYGARDRAKWQHVRAGHECQRRLG